MNMVSSLMGPWVGESLLSHQPLDNSSLEIFYDGEGHLITNEERNLGVQVFL